MSMPFRALLAPVTLIVLTWMSPALAMRTIDFAEYRLPEEGAIAVPVEEAEQLTGVAAAVNEATGGSLAAALAAFVATRGGRRRWRPRGRSWPASARRAAEPRARDRRAPRRHR